MTTDRKSFFSTYLQQITDSVRYRAYTSMQAAMGLECVVCGRVDQPQICQSCRDKITILDNICQICGLQMVGKTINNLCQSCIVKPPSYEKIHYIGAYENILSDLIIHAKLGKRLSAVNALMSLAENHSGALIKYKDYSLLTMPTSRWRLIQRGFNLPAMITKTLSKKHHLTVIPAIAVTLPFYTKKQAKLNRQQRQKNPHFYQINQKIPQKIIIVEDIVTSAATVSELAKTLRMNGAKSIVVWALARSHLGSV